MALWKRGRRCWTQTMINGVRIRQPLCPAGSTRATTKWQEAVQLEKDLIKAAIAGKLRRARSHESVRSLRQIPAAKEATANTTRVVEFDRERLEVVKRYLGDIRLSSITRETIEGFQAKRRVDGASNRTVNMDVGALRRVSEAVQALASSRGRRQDAHRIRRCADRTGADRRRAGTAIRGRRRKPGMDHVYCAAVLAANTSMRGVEIKHLRRKDIDLDANASTSARARTKAARGFCR